MDPVVKEASETAQHTWLIGVATALFAAAFLGLLIWLWVVRSKGDYEEAARLPLEDDEKDDRDGLRAQE